MKKMHKCKLCKYKTQDKPNFNKHRLVHFVDSESEKKKIDLNGDFSCRLHQ